MNSLLKAILPGTRLDPGGRCESAAECRGGKCAEGHY